MKHGKGNGCEGVDILINWLCNPQGNQSKSLCHTSLVIM